MTHQNHLTNGASLEDCHTNFFALTELYGIKWRKLVWGESGGSGTGGRGMGGGGGGGEGDEAAPLADPVISSYARCLAGDILCVWRRVPAPQPPADLLDVTPSPPPAPPPLSLRAAKELWIFWYGEEPDLSGLVAPELIASQSEQGSWESGLSYECRSLLFKALHNLIERCLLSRDFVRLGKWFVQPYDGDEDDVGKSPWHLSFSFAFFLHGESTVCASVDVRQHPPVRTVSARRLQRAARLAPPSDHAHHHTDSKVILAPFGLEGAVTGREYGESDPRAARLLDAWRHIYPLEQNCSALEVICGGVRMLYPAPYVLFTEMEEPRPDAGGARAPHQASHLMAERAVRAAAHPPVSVPTIITTANTAAGPGTGRHNQSTELCNGDVSDKADFDFLDPTRKALCTCAKWRRRPGRRAPPFHRRQPARPATMPRAPPAHALAHPPVGACSPGSCGGGSPAAPVSAPPSAGAPPPSPSVTHTSIPPNQSGPCVPTALHTPAPTPDPLAPPTPAPPSAPSARHYIQGGESPSAGGVGGGGGTVARNGGIEFPVAELSRRPVLPIVERKPDPLEEEHSLRMLYDYSTVYAWLEHPVKRFKSEDSFWRDEATLSATAAGSNNGDLYEGHDHTRMATVPDHSMLLAAAAAVPAADIKQEKQELNEDIKEYKNLFTSNGLCPTLKDLDQIFDNSDDAASGDESVRLLQVQTPPDSNKSCDEGRGGSGGCGTAGGGRAVRAEELSKMFPTPPSLEAHAQSSPGFTPVDDHPALHRLACVTHGSPAPHTDVVEDWSYVFKTPTVAQYEGSAKYAPLTNLPSQMLPPVALPPHAVYRPRWQQDKRSQALKRPASPANTSTPLPPVHSAGTISAPASVGCPGSVGGAPSAPAGPSPAPRAPTYAPSPPTPDSPCERSNACPLLLNVLLADTVLNVFRDHNFDSCTLCVCNAGPKVVGNIRGADAATYLNGSVLGSGNESPAASPAPPYDEDPIRCTCGFSAIVNRRLSHRAGLFYEDEMEITGLAEDPSLRTSGGAGAGNDAGIGTGTGSLTDVADLVLAQCSSLGGSASALARAARAAAQPRPPDELRLNLLEYSDGGDAATLALRAAAGGTGFNGAVHRWPFIGARGPRSSRDVVRLMRRLRPLLQDAIQKRCCGARMWDGVTGPLTWRQFHRLAGRGNEDLCEPQPVPPILVGHDRDWISLSPYALRHWERLALEPYSYSRDVVYLVLTPDNEALTEPLRTFFRELSTMYESCRLGRHVPIWRLAKDGLVRVSASAVSEPATHDWVGEVPDDRLGKCLRGYAEMLRTDVVPKLANLNVDGSLLEPEVGARAGLSAIERPSPSPMRPPSTPDHPPTPSSQSDQETDSSIGSTGGSVNTSNGAANTGATGGVGSGSGGTGGGGALDEEEGGPPALVLYLVEPPAAHARPNVALHAMLRMAARLTHHLRHHNPLVKIISLEGVCETWGVGGGGRSELRALAFSVFTGARRLLMHTANGKSLTGFGTAANANLFLKSKDDKNRAAYKLYTPAYVLAPPKAIKDVAETWGRHCAAEQCSVLFLSYCLSHDQRWLLATATDARGELLDTVAIDIHVPARSRRRRAAPARRLGLTKLMDFTLGVMSQSAQPWRLVVGRVGRIGHGELKGWSWLLSRKNLVRASNSLREICGSCSVLYPSGVPCILSACLVSTEPDSCLRLMADRFTPDERFSQVSIASHLHTPRDVTATHILVFPTSATTQSNQMPFEQPITNGENDDMMFLGVDMGDEDMGEDNISDLLIGDMLNNMWAPNSPRASPRRHDDDPGGSREGSPAPQPHHGTAHYAHGDDASSYEQVGTVLQQPLALGYMVSTAPLGQMPAWWWAGCAHLRDSCPAFLKNALHLHSGGVQSTDDFTTLTQRRDQQHPLDSTTTTDVLRYVLEGYNALSWLALDASTHDRVSCLPLHVQVLMQLYHTAAALG